MEISEALIDRELQTDEEAVIRVIDRALADLGEAERVVLKVHPEDARLLRAAEAEDSLSPSSISHFDIVADASIRRGGCMLESDRGQIDATIEARFEEIERHLQGTTGAVSP
jgi:flagellar assembly protein FliH